MTDHEITDDEQQRDERLLAELAAAVHTRQRVPDSFLRIGRAAFTWREVDSELARLSYDSAADAEGMLAGTRADPGSLRALSFVAGDVTLDVELTEAALQGQLTPPGGTEIELQLADGSSTSVAVDQVGWFILTPPPSGMFRFRLRSTGGAATLTPWTSATAS